MFAIERTTKLFVASLNDALPDVDISISRSTNRAGRSNYVYVATAGCGWRPIKVRISDHPVGMRRALYGDEALYIPVGAKPSSWSVWIGELRRRELNSNQRDSLGR